MACHNQHVCRNEWGQLNILAGGGQTDCIDRLLNLKVAFAGPIVLETIGQYGLQYAIDG